MQAHRERERTEARFLSDQLLEEGRWHHVMVVLNKALIRNSTCALFVDGKHVSTCRVSAVFYCECFTIEYLTTKTKIQSQRPIRRRENTPKSQ